MKLFSFTFAVSCVALCLAPNSAEAVSVTVNGTTYDVNTFSGPYNANNGWFNTLDNNGLMPWWGNESLAEQFATAVGVSLGTPTYGVYGPEFAHSLSPTLFGGTYVNGEVFQAPSTVLNFGWLTYESGTYATATLAPPPPPAAVPGPLPLFGAAAAFGMSRRLRRKIQLGG
ncbi:MAG: hypothetical protein ACK55X_05085 [Synechococcaceae cyanobacterium]